MCEFVFAFEVGLVFVSLVEFKINWYAVCSCCEVGGYELVAECGFAFGVVKVDVDAFDVFAGFVVECVVDYQNATFDVFGFEFFFDELFSGVV